MRWIAGLLSFGAGLMLFSVTVEMYGTAMWELEEMQASNHLNQGVREILVTIFFAFLGAAGFIAANRWLQSVCLSSAAEVDGEKGDGGELGCSEGTPLLAKSPSEWEHERKLFRTAMVGLESWFGVFISGIPEGCLLGQFASEQRVSTVFVLSLFVSNFPTALASASLLRQGGRSNREILGLWTSVFVCTGLLAGIWPLIFPALPFSASMQVFASAVEGLAGGSMLACVLAVMLPEAYNLLGDIAGLVCVSGFLAAVCIKVFGGLVEDWIEHAPFDFRVEGAPPRVRAAASLLQPFCGGTSPAACDDLAAGGVSASAALSAAAAQGACSFLSRLLARCA